MSSVPLVSIVLPTYNGARYLAQSIDSCMAQTYQDWELIIVDDHSTDDTPAIISSYMGRDPRIRALRNPTNRKLPASLNAGFAEARGELFTWTSDDNCYRPEALEEMVAFLKGDPSIDFVYTDFTLVDDEGSPMRPGWTGPLDRLPLECCIGACFLYRRAVHERLGGYDESLFLVEDYDFWLRASVLFRLAMLPKDLYLYRWHQNSLTMTRAREVRRAHERCLTKNLPRMTWMSPDLCVTAYQKLVHMAIERGDRLAALSHLFKAMRSHPAKMARREAAAAAYLLLPSPLFRLLYRNKPLEWTHRRLLATQEIAAVVPAQGKFILVDEDQWGSQEQIAGRHRIPFLERGGLYWGPPPDDDTAIREIERLRHTGASFVVFAWPAFWWLEYYPGLNRFLQSQFRCRLRNDRLVVFDLRQ
jgi:glycosyltransferase involved in cell wall biosynthesis